MGRLSSYISRGVYTVSAPFHPFGGAVDIIVVEQQDGSFKSSPWYVRFGKFQGVLKTREKVVGISVNGADANFHMYLDHKGEAFFLKEVDVEEGESMLYPSFLSSGDERDDESSDKKNPLKSKSCNFDANGQKLLAAPIDVSTGKIVPRTNSRRGRFLGLVFGRKTMKPDSEADMPRVNSLERAEIAADLLDVRWSTSLATKKAKKDKTLESAEGGLDGEANNDGESHEASCVNEGMENGNPSQLEEENGLCHEGMSNNSQSGFHNSECSVGGESQAALCMNVEEENGSDPSQLEEENGFCHKEMSNNSQSGFHNSECSIGEASFQATCLCTQVETPTLYKNNLEEICEVSEISEVINEVGVGDAGHHDNVESVTSFMTTSESQMPETAQPGVSPCKQFNEEEAFDERDAVLLGHDVLGEENERAGVQSIIYCETSESATVRLDGSIKETQETLYLACGDGEVHVQAETVHETTELISKVSFLLESGITVKSIFQTNQNF